MTKLTLIFYSLLLTFLCLDLFSQNESNKSVIIKEIQITGNQKTKDKIILREIEFKKGDTLNENILKDKILKSTQNIQNTSLFNFVKINIDTISQNSLNVNIQVVERWYIWPYAFLKTAENNINYWWIEKNINHLTLMTSIVDLNFRGVREQLSLKTNIGYNNSIGFTYSIPYINKSKTLGLSFESYWTKNHEVKIGTIDLKDQFYKLKNDFLFESFSSGISLLYRPAYRLTEQFSIGYNLIHFNDSIFNQNPSFITQNKIQCFSLYSKLKIDYRDDKSYPLNGFYSDFIITQIGLNTLASEDFYKTSAQFNFRYYHQFGKIIHTANGINIFNSNRNRNAEFFGTNIGDSFNEIRGYENYKIPVESSIIIKNNIGFTISQKKTKHLPLLKSDNIRLVHYAIYMNAFFDAAYINEDKKRNITMNMQNPIGKFIYSSGIGIDFVTYYDLVFRFEMSHNFLFNKFGFFVNLKASI